jgi:beta-lactamase regulating signal transducer with metallopeptidase domain
VLRPRIIVPADFTAHYNGSEQTLILAHEQQHLKHGDHWWNFLALLLHTVFWFHPLLPVAKRWFRSDQKSLAMRLLSVAIRKTPLRTSPPC